MVTRPEHYVWSSYRGRVGITVCDWLDPDPCFLALASDDVTRRERYREFVEQGISVHELKFIRDAVQRNQLTGSEAFMLEIEQRTGERILFRSRGRPGSRSSRTLCEEK